MLVSREKLEISKGILVLGRAVTNPKKESAGNEQPVNVNEQVCPVLSVLYFL